MPRKWSKGAKIGRVEVARIQALGIPDSVIERYQMAHEATEPMRGVQTPKLEKADNVLYCDGLILGADDWMYFEETDLSASKVRQFLGEQGGDDVVVALNSIGGDSAEGESIRVLLAGYDGDVTVQVVGAAYSAAAHLSFGAGRVEMSAGSLMMIHCCWSCLCGNAAKLRAQADVQETFDKGAAAVYAAKLNADEAEVMDYMQAEKFFDAAGAIEIGMADALMAVDAEPEGKGEETPPKSAGIDTAGLRGDSTFMRARSELAGVL